jgi:predicted secreted hydrolase
MLIEQVGADQLTHKVSGQGWFDHEWTSQLLDQQTLGWDWFSIHLDGGEKLMAFRMRLRDNPNYVTGTLIEPNGTTTTLDNGTITINPLAYELDTDNNKKFPTQWSLTIPQRDMAITISPQKQKQWNRGRFLYYEGAIGIAGTHEGEGFMELTGY